MKLHLPHLLRRAVVRALFAAATVVTTLASATHADMITPDGRTATQVIQSGNVYDVYTNTVRGNTGFNSFSTFDVYAETTANLHLADGTGRLINVVRDSASHIDGVLNSYRDGRIGGDVYFLNPNGIIVGKTGVVNVGSISMSTPTAAFVEQLIARDGSISPTATQAVLAGDMPINEKGTISIKGKVNARGTAELRAGKVEVKDGGINTGVKFREMVNTGKRKVDTQGMSIQDGRLSFGKKPAKARRVAKAEAREKKTENPEKKADIAIFANDVLVDASALNAASVYIDPDTAEIFGTISGEYMVEARAIIAHDLSVKEGETLTSFTLYAANELTDGTYEGNVSITLSNSNIVADSIYITATATTNAAEAGISITGSTLRAEKMGSALSICASSVDGDARVEIGGNASLWGIDSVDVSAFSRKGNTALTLDASAVVTANALTLTAAAIEGDAAVKSEGGITGGNTVSITASTGTAVSDYTEEMQISDMEFEHQGGGDAKVEVTGNVTAKGALSVSAVAQGTSGDAEIKIDSTLSSQYAETQPVGELGFERTGDLAINEDDDEELISKKNAAYLDAYIAYLDKLDKVTAPTGTINVTAAAVAGNASISQTGKSELQSDLSAALLADASKRAEINLEGKVNSGDIAVSATGREEAELKVAWNAELHAAPHLSVERHGTVNSVEESDGSIMLTAGTPYDETEQTGFMQALESNANVNLVVEGSLFAMRGNQPLIKDGSSEGGTIYLSSEGSLTVGQEAKLTATSGCGVGGTIVFDAPEYSLQNPDNYLVDGVLLSTPGSIVLMNHEELSGEQINQADEIAREFIERTLGGGQTGNGIDYNKWTGAFRRITLSGNIELDKDFNASITMMAIAAGTQIKGNGHSLNLTEHSSHNFQLVNNKVTIGDGVTITGVKDFTIRYRNRAVADTLCSSYIADHTVMSVGKNFTVGATGKVSITVESPGYTFLTFGEGLNINAGGDVTISATTSNGYGSSMLSSAMVDPIAKILKQVPPVDDPKGEDAKNWFSKIGIVRFNMDKFIHQMLAWVFTGDPKGKNLYMPQIGVRVSQAAVTFASGNAGSITGNSVTIASKSTADVSGRKVWTNSFLGASLGFTHNSSTVDLGKNLKITATGYKKEHVSKDEVLHTSVSITSSTITKNSLEAQYTSSSKDLAVGIQGAVVHDFNTLTIDQSVQITGLKDINIAAKSNLNANPFLSLDSTSKSKVAQGKPTEIDNPARVALTLGVNFIQHKTEATVNGTLVSSQGDINMKSEDCIASSITMNSSIKATLVEKTGAEDKDADDWWGKFKKILKDCIVFDVGFGKAQIDKEFEPYFKLNNLRLWGDKPAKLWEAFDVDASDKKPRVALAFASDIVITNNLFNFNGKANAEKGSVTLGASTEVEAACGAETSIVGVPVSTAVTGSVSVPVIRGNTTTEVGSSAIINAGKDIRINSSTELPLSYDLIGWRAWKDFVVNQIKNPGKDTAKIVSALRGSLKYLADYHDNGELGVLDSVTTSHASTIMSNTGDTGDTGKTVGGSVLVDLRHFNTKTVVRDDATLTAAGTIGVKSSAKGIQFTFGGQLPCFMTLTVPQYHGEKWADSGFGGSALVAQKSLNTFTYIGAATLKANALKVDALGDVFMLEMGLGGSIGNSDTSVQGGVNIIIEDKTTISEISGGAKLTLTGGKSEVTATDKSTLINISGMAVDGAKDSFGFGVAITINNALTAAMLGNNLPITSTYADIWKSQMGDDGLRFDRPEAITMDFGGSAECLTVEAVDRATLINIGIAGALQRKQNESEPVEVDGDGAEAGVAGNVGVTYNHSETDARQYKVVGPGSSAVSGNGNNSVITKAGTDSTIVAVSGDAVINARKEEEDTAIVTGAVSLNLGKMDAQADVTDCEYANLKDFSVDAHDNSTVVAVDMAVAVGAAKAGVAAGVSWNVLTGNTSAFLSGGTVSAGSVSVASSTNLTSLSCTLGGAIDIRLSSEAMNGYANQMGYEGFLRESNDRNNADVLEDDLQKNGINPDENEALLDDGEIPFADMESLAWGEEAPVLGGDGENGLLLEVGATIARNVLTMHSSAIVEGCTVTTPGKLEVKATDTSVITSVSVAAAIKGSEDGDPIGAGAVLSFAPVASVTEAVIRQKTGKSGKLAINAGTLTLEAKDNHRERVWSIGGGFANCAGVNLVLSWGSFARNNGGKTAALLENVDATVASKVDILSSATLDATYIAVGGSGSKNLMALTAMVNYLNFNNQVVADIKGSNLTVTAAKGVFKAQAENKRTFTDGVGALGLTLGSGSKLGCGGGGAFSFLYLGGNGKDDTNLTAVTVHDSVINNSGTTELFANSTTKGILAGANASVQYSAEEEPFGLALTGSISWLSDASFTQVDIKDSFFNKRALAKEEDKNATIKVEATSSSDLTFGFGSLGARIGRIFKGDAKSLALGFTYAKIKDAATTAATMNGGGVGNARDFTLHASGKADMAALLIGGGGGDGFGISGAALSADITHNVASSLEESVMNMTGALTIKAENTSNIGKDKGTRFTVANSALGVSTGTTAADVSIINVADIVSARAKNVSVHSGSMLVEALETNNVDIVTVNVAGGKYAGLEVNVVRPVLKGTANAAIVSDKEQLPGETPVGIHVSQNEVTDGDGKSVTTTGDLVVNATNKQWLRSHLWAFDVTFTKDPFSTADIVSVNSTNMTGSAYAGIDGKMPVGVGGKLDITATADRYATYTTVPVALALASRFTFAGNVEVNTLWVSDYNEEQRTTEQGAKRKSAAMEIDKQVARVLNLIKDAQIKPDKDIMLTLSGDIQDSMTRASNAIDQAITPPKTTAVLNLHGQTADVTGIATIQATDKIGTEPYTVPVTGGVLAANVNVLKTRLMSTLETKVQDTTLNAEGGITIKAEQPHKDNFHNVAVPIGLGAAIEELSYRWRDDSITYLSLEGSTKLNSAKGSITIETEAKPSETFTHHNVDVAFYNLSFFFPIIDLDGYSQLSIGDGVAITAPKGNITIKTTSDNTLNATLFDLVIGFGNGVDVKKPESDLHNTQILETGNGVVISGGGNVSITQKGTSTLSVSTNYIGITVGTSSVPSMYASDYTDSQLIIGNRNEITSTSGNLTIESIGTATSTLYFGGRHIIGFTAEVGLRAEHILQSVHSKVTLGDNVKLRAQKGAMAVRAKSHHTTNMTTYQLAANAASISQYIATDDHGSTTSTVTIGNGFDALGESLTLEALNTDIFNCKGDKVTITLAINPYSKNAINVASDSEATITLGGGKIDVKKFTAKAQTDVTVKATQLLAGGSITVDVNGGKVYISDNQKAYVTLGTGTNNLDILTDDISVTAHNKHLFTSLNDSHSMVYGADFAIGFGTSIGYVDSWQDLDSAVTLGTNTHVLRRADAAHYVERDKYTAIFSATNNVESNTQISLRAYGLLNSNCEVTTWDDTKAKATLTINGSIDTWGNTELTAYSHARHDMINSVTSGSIIPTHKTDVKNLISTTDTVNINGAVESIGDVVIQAGSTNGEYTLVDGTTVQGGRDDTNTTHYFWGKKAADISNKRTEALAITADVRAGGELVISNDSSANTSRKPFKKTGTSNDFTNAAIDTAAEVTSSVTLGSDVKLYAGLAAAVQMYFEGTDANLRFISTQKIFDGSVEDKEKGIWTASGPELKPLYSTATAAGKNSLVVGAVTLPGMAFRIDTKAGQDVFAKKLYSPAKHGLDILVPSDWGNGVQTMGVALLGYETGLIFNREAVSDAVLGSSAADHLYLQEGVSIRSAAGGDLTLSGCYVFPYSTFHVSSARNLIINGFVASGTTTLQADGNIFYDNSAADYAVGRSALSMYSKLFESWEATIPGLVEKYADGIAVASGNHGKITLKPPSGNYTPKTDYTTVFDNEAIKKAAGEGTLTPTIAAGKVYIKAKVVDLNGQLYSGLQSSDITIDAAPALLTSDNKRISVADANELFRTSGGANRIFRLDGFRGISLVYDAQTQEISLNNYTTLPTGIYIEGIIVNTNPLGSSGLYIAGNTRPLNIVNKSNYTLNIGNVDMTATRSEGIVLKNTGNNTVTTYTQDAQGNWVEKVKNSDGSITMANVDGATKFTYTNVADYQVQLQRAVETLITEHGRLSFTGGILNPKVKKGYVCPKDKPGYIDCRETIIDSFDIEKPTYLTPVLWEYVPSSTSKVNSGTAVSRHEMASDKVLAEDLYNPGEGYRYQYTLQYKERSYDSLYISAANPVSINLGSGSATALNVTGGNVNFTGTVKTPICSVTATGAITATANAHIEGKNIYMEAAKGIGSDELALIFTADKAGFNAGQDLYLLSRQDAQLYLTAGRTLNLVCNGSISDIEFHSKGDAFIQADGQITMKGGNPSSAASSTTLVSANGGILVEDSTASLGALTAIALNDICFSSSSDKELALSFVDSQTGEVKIAAQKDIVTVAGSNMSNLYAVPGSKDLTLSGQAVASKGDLSDDYFEKLLYYEKLYYEKDKDGNYLHRAADGTTFLLPEEKEALETLCSIFKELYNSGQGDYLAAVMYSLSETPAVGGTKFATMLDAAHYLAEHSDKLEDFAVGYYNKMVAGITSDIQLLHGPELTPADYGSFNEEICRLYWLKDDKGRYVNRDKDGNFINPDRYDALGNKIGKMYSEALCAAISAEYKGKRDPRGEYMPQKSEALAELASAVSGYSSVQLKLALEDGNFASLAGSRPIGESQVSIHAKKGVTLNAGENQSIGGGQFNFNISPVAWRDGEPVYSDWANLFISQSQKYPNLQILGHNEETGEWSFALPAFYTNLERLDALQVQLLQQVVPIDITNGHGFFTVGVRGYVCVAIDEGNLNATGDNVLLTAMQDLDFSEDSIIANNLFLSTTGSITGSLKGAEGMNGKESMVVLHADGGFGTEQKAFNISGDSTVFSLLSDSDVYLHTQGDIHLATLKGNNVSIDAREGDLLPALHRNLEANVTGRRVNFYGNLDKGLSFSTFGTSEATGGLHWYGGASSKFVGDVYNTVYNFWFKNESGTTSLDSVNLGYSGHLVLDGLQEIKDATFRQVGKATSMSILEFTGTPTFAESLTLDGEGAYSVISPGKITLGSASGLHIGGDATLRLAGIGSVDGNPIHIVSTGNLSLGNCDAPDSACLVENGLVIDSPGTITLNAVTSTGTMVLNGRRGISGREVKARQIVANSPGGGVFLNADTEDLSGSSWNSFVVDLEPLDNGTTVTVHDISANAMTATVLVRSLSKELKLGGSISGAALRFYSTGDIVLTGGDVLDSDYPFLDVQSSQNPNVETMTIDPVNADLPERFVWDIEHSFDDASRDSKEVQELRRMLDGEDEIPTVPALRFLDKDGNTVSREQYANLITIK